MKKKKKLTLIQKFKHIIGYNNVSLFKNALYLLLGRYSNAIFGFIFWFLISRFFFEYEVGIISSIFSAINWIAMIALLGLDDTIRRYSVEDTISSKKIILGSLVIVFLLSFFLSIVYVIILTFIPEFSVITRNILNYIILILFCLASSTSFMLDAIFVSKRKTIFIFIRAIISGILKNGLLIIFLFMGIMGAFISLSISHWSVYIIFALILLPRFFKNFKINLRDILTEFRKHKKYSSTNYISNLIGSLPGGLMATFILIIGTPEIASYFYIPWTIFMLISAISISISTSYLVECVKRSEKRIKLLIKSYKVIFFLLFSILLIVIFLGKIVLNLYGQNYKEKSYILLIFFTVSGFFYGFNALMISLYRCKERVYNVLIFNIIIVVTSFSFVGITFKYLEHIAVGIGWLLAQILGGIFNGMNLRKFIEEINQSD